MSAAIADLVLHPLLEQAREAARRAGLAYAGGVPPQVAWSLVRSGEGREPQPATPTEVPVQDRAGADPSTATTSAAGSSSGGDGHV